MGLKLGLRNVTKTLLGAAAVTAIILGGVTTPGVIPGITPGYDTSIGNGVDANGRANLPLRDGAQRWYVNSATGSDDNPGTAEQPFATILKGAQSIVKGRGDQVLVAEGTTYSEGLPNMTGRDGLNSFYPTVLQSYDPADPYNEDRLGRTLANRPVVMTGTTSSSFLMGGGDSPSFIVSRCFDCNPGNNPSCSIVQLPNTNGVPNYILWENNIFRYCSHGYDGAAHQPAIAQHMIWRGNSFFGVWATNGFGQSIYTDFVDHLTIEYNHFYHSGWRIGATRGEGTATGGGSWFGHTMYLQENTHGAVVRGNLMLDSISESASCRGDITFVYNVGLRNPVAVGLGSGTNYDTGRPDGVDILCAYNAFLESASTPDGGGVAGGGAHSWGMDSRNGKPGSRAHHNILARSSEINAGTGMTTGADYNQPSYMDWDHNIIDGWNTINSNINEGGAFPAQVHATYNYNALDDAPFGTNHHITDVVRPNRYTVATLITALGYGSEAAFINDVMLKPELQLGPKALALLQAGYGLSAIDGIASAVSLGSLTLSDTVFAIGTAKTVNILGATAGSTINCSDLPTYFTLDSTARTLTYDGGGTGSSTPTFHLSEVKAGAVNSPNSNAITIAVNAPATVKFNDATASSGASFSPDKRTVTRIDASAGTFTVLGDQAKTSGKFKVKVIAGAGTWQNRIGISDGTVEALGQGTGHSCAYICEGTVVFNNSAMGGFAPVPDGGEVEVDFSDGVHVIFSVDGVPQATIDVSSVFNGSNPALPAVQSGDGAISGQEWQLEPITW